MMPVAAVLLLAICALAGAGLVAVAGCNHETMGNRFFLGFGADRLD
jgi:hypothetical protein